MLGCGVALALAPAISSGQGLFAGVPIQSVSLTWAASVDATVAGYRIYSYTNAAGFTNKLDAGNNLTAIVTNLQPGVTYSFFATAYTANQLESLPSNRITFTPGPPRSPTNLTATVSGTYSVELRWQPSAYSHDGFYVERSLDGINFTRVATLGTYQTNYTVTDMLAFAAASYPYWFRVTAFRGTQISAYSNLATGLTNKADLVVSLVSLSPAAPVEGNAVTLTAAIRNQGVVAKPLGSSVQVSFSIDGIPVAWDTFTNALMPGETMTLTAQQSLFGSGTWLASAGYHSIAAVVDAEGALLESDESNNQLKAAVAVPALTVPAISITLNKPSIQETDATGATFTFTRTGSTLLPLSVALKVSGTARSGGNFSPLPSLIVIPTGSASASLALKPLRDAQVCPNKTVTVGLQADVAYQPGPASTATLVILNSDVDSDGDGMSDAAEALAGTDPSNRQSNLRFTSLISGPGRQLTVNWLSVPGVSYQVCYRPTLAEGDWTPVSPALIATDTTTTWSFTATNTSGFYGLGLNPGAGL